VNGGQQDKHSIYVPYTVKNKNKTTTAATTTATTATTTTTTTTTDARSHAWYLAVDPSRLPKPSVMRETNQIRNWITCFCYSNIDLGSFLSVSLIGLLTRWVFINGHFATKPATVFINNNIQETADLDLSPLVA
jgi:hypothetical protein